MPDNQLILKAVKPVLILPTKVDLRKKMPPIYDQGNLGSCTANALCAAYTYVDPIYYGSRLFLYYNERLLGNNVKEDTGAYLSDGIVALKKYGLCTELEWPYNIRQFNVAPPEKCYVSGLKERVIRATNIPNDLRSMKNCLNAGVAKSLLPLIA